MKVGGTKADRGKRDLRRIVETCTKGGGKDEIFIMYNTLSFMNCGRGLSVTTPIT